MAARTKEELAAAVDEAEWDWLRAHLERGGLITVAAGLDLAEVGVAMAADETATVSKWIEAGLLGKPSFQQIQEWDRHKSKKFLTLIVSPYVLIMEKAEGEAHAGYRQ